MRIFATLILTLMLSWSWGQQYEIAFSSDTTDSVCPWVYGHYITQIGANNLNSKNNFKNANISAIGGDTVFMKCVDTTHIDSIVSVDWVILNNYYQILFFESCVSSIAYVLPDDSVFLMTIACFNANTIDTSFLVFDPFFIGDSAIAYSYPFYSKFVQTSPTLDFLSKTNNITLTISDFGVKTLSSSADTSYIDSVRWYNNGVLFKEDTIKFISTDSLGGNYSIQVKNKMVAVFNGSTVLHDGIWSSMSDTICIPSGIQVNINENIQESNFLSIYPNPVETTLYISDEFEYCVFSITGQQILGGRGKEIDVSCFKPGIYILKANNESLRFLVQ